MLCILSPVPRAGQGIVLLDQLMCSVWGSDDQRVEEFHARAQVRLGERESSAIVSSVLWL